ncbi:CD225/dispanin family protein [Nocardia arizonensis]|uniref:CD225/dispanin family protein n=1 Tax=Nocardia arizonensis TaxID=1141647 RepID=UPI0009EAC045|nr:CD225/dispanin family protein [Nocardia arizonensis]
MSVPSNPGNEDPEDRAPKYPPPQYPPLPPQSQYPPPRPNYQPPGPQQPQYGPPAGSASAYWPLSIISFLMSCIIGAIALFFSYQVGEKNRVGDTEGAARASRMALIFGIAGIVLGLLGLIVVFGSGEGQAVTRVFTR